MNNYNLKTSNKGYESHVARRESEKAVSGWSKPQKQGLVTHIKATKKSVRDSDPA